MANKSDRKDFLPTAEDEKYMRRCLELAATAEGRTAPNPLVGCVVLDKNGNVVGEGFHPKAGESHAEVFALNQAGEAASGGTLYCSLEPCCHFGRTPPCSDRVIKSGVARVVVGIGDPNPRVEGGGIKALESAGIDVSVGVLAEECRYQNRAFLKVMNKGLPWVALKMATTLDGKIADRHGASQWISGEESRLLVMNLRSRVDAILIGAGTARKDNPSLTVRIGETGETLHAPVKVIIDSCLSISTGSRLFQPLADGRSVRTIIFCADDQASADSNVSFVHKRSDYPAHVEIIDVASEVSADGQKRVNLQSALAELKSRGINFVLCEGGAELNGSLFDSGLVDEVFWFVAPKILADSGSRSAVLSARQRSMAEIINLNVKECRTLGQDVLIHALLHQP